MFPYLSICAGLIMTCRDPCQARSKIDRNGIQPSTGPGAGSPSAHVPVTNRASPSDSSRSGSNVALASRAPAVGISPIGLAAISPSPRHASAQATMQISALLALASPSSPLIRGATISGTPVCSTPAVSWTPVMPARLARSAATACW